MTARGEAGFAGGFAGLLFGLLIFIVGTLLAGYAWSVVDTKSAAVDAAREAARSYVEAASASSAIQAAQQAADSTLAGRGRDPARATVTLTGGSFGRCQRITISVAYPAPALVLPFLGPIGGSAGTEVTARHSELVDPYRTGLPGSSACQ